MEKASMIRIFLVAVIGIFSPLSVMLNDPTSSTAFLAGANFGAAIVYIGLQIVICHCEKNVQEVAPQESEYTRQDDVPSRNEMYARSEDLKSRIE